MAFSHKFLPRERENKRNTKKITRCSGHFVLKVNDGAAEQLSEPDTKLSKLDTAKRTDHKAEVDTFPVLVDESHLHHGLLKATSPFEHSATKSSLSMEQQNPLNKIWQVLGFYCMKV